ncbi:MAG: hypothetical protein ACON31_01780 [Candidatus Puniceispirillaceae bacterium]
MDIILKKSDLDAMPTELRRPLLAFLANRLQEDEKVEIERELAQATKDGSILVRPTVIPIEAACAVVFGLNQNSILALEAILEAPKEGLSRKELGKILGSERAINGTVGSINRRFIHRFDDNVYDLDAALKEMPLITYKTNYRIETGLAEFNHMAFRIAVHLKKMGLSLEAKDITLIMPDKKKLRLLSASYHLFLKGSGSTNLYQYRPECPVSLEGQSAHAIQSILLTEGIPVVMCTGQPCASIVCSDGINSVYKIGIRLFEPGTNYAKCQVEESYSTQCLDPAEFEFVVENRMHPSPLSKGGQA